MKPSATRSSLAAAAVALTAVAAAAQTTDAQTAEEPMREVDITDPDAPPIEDAETVIPEEEAELKAETGLTSPTHTAPTTAEGVVVPNAPEGFDVADMSTMDPTELIGVRVYTGDDDQVGEIGGWIGEEPGRLPEGAVLDLGGVLGLAEREVAVETERLMLLTDEDGNDMRVYVDLTEDELDELPQLD